MISILPTLGGLAAVAAAAGLVYTFFAKPHVFVIIILGVLLIAVAALVFMLGYSAVADFMDDIRR